MTAAFVLDAMLGLLLVGTAVSAVAGRDLFASIAFFVTYGILIGLAWLRLGAVDVALAEVAIGAGLTGVLLIGAWSMLQRRCGDGGNDPAMPVLPKLAAAAVSVTVTGMLALAVLALPVGAPGLVPLVTENISESGVGNPVTAVLLNFRAYDTLMESIVLLIALVAVWALTPKELWGGVPGLRQHARPDGVLATFGRLLPPLGLVVAVYVVWAGSEMPGGAFQAGTILAAVWLLVVMAGIAEEPRMSSRLLRLALVVGPAVFLGVGLVGAAFGSFLGLPVDFAKALILAIEFALTFSIAVTLALLVAGTPREGT
ncbi:hydrogenase subunit MbhD domain-containing protein [Paracoccus sp. J55]|uniref:hydrogenase subunit MbhD domain-containing protein n=1 Tax=Paracoccus sp. J55 TaxID=935849 RepID=UPI0004908C20|nr:hydrogenase subunit MbhD domain-containing protein [Paracoccus sp. J55]